VYFVPAFSGLFAPYWRRDARGVIAGLTGTSTPATSRAPCWRRPPGRPRGRRRDGADSGVDLTELKVDGGMVGNELLMQFQADVLGVPVVRPVVAETTRSAPPTRPAWRSGSGRARRTCARTGARTSRR
jgi:glycerol kinase